MKREELLTDAMLFFPPNERSITAENGARYYREDVVLKAMELAGKELSLPPAEGAETCWNCGIDLLHAPDGVTKYHCICGATNPGERPTAEGAEEILRRVINETIGDPGTDKFHWHIHQDIAIKAMQEFATLHARKMARENMREELIKFDVWLTGRGVSVDNVLIIREVDDYLKSKEQ